MRFTATQTNKIIAKVDRYFSWDSKIVENGKHITVFDYDRNMHICVIRSKQGMRCVIHQQKGDEVTRVEETKNSWKEINEFIKMVKLIG